MSIPLAFRPYRPATDRNWLFATWIGCYEKSPWAGCLPRHLATSVHKAVINTLLDTGMTVTVAVNPDDDDQLIGFIAYEKPQADLYGVLHFVAVKDLFRRSGVATRLLEHAGFKQGEPITHTFKTADARYLGKLIHKPGLARRISR